MPEQLSLKDARAIVINAQGLAAKPGRADKTAGPLAPCPYGSDERNGIWVFGKQKAKQGLSFAQTCRAFRKMESI